VVSALALFNKVINTGPVTTRMGDSLQTGILSQYMASHLGQLSLLPYVGW